MSASSSPTTTASAPPAVRVPFLDLQVIHTNMADQLISEFASFVHSGAYILGKPVESFEQAFASYQQSQHCIGVGNGLDAITLSLKALNIGEGDHVIVPSNTFIATWLACSQVGAHIVAAEPNPQTHLLDADSIRKVLTEKTRAVIVVHLYGQMAPMDEIEQLCRERNLSLIEDAAQAHGAEHKGRRAGSIGDTGCFSFYPGKNLGALGDGGAITTNSAELAERLRLLRNYGSSQKYIHDEQGYNSRLDTIQAAILQAKLKHLDQWNDRRRAIADTYLQALANAPGLTLPQVITDCKHVWHLFVVRHPQRENLRALLDAAGVQTLIHYPVPPHKQKAYSGQKFPQLPIAEKLAGEIFSLPMGPHLSDDQVSYTVESLLAACSQLA